MATLVSSIIPEHTIFKLAKRAEVFTWISNFSEKGFECADGCFEWWERVGDESGSMRWKVEAEQRNWYLNLFSKVSQRFSSIIKTLKNERETMMMEWSIEKSFEILDLNREVELNGIYNFANFNFDPPDEGFLSPQRKCWNTFLCLTFLFSIIIVNNSSAKQNADEQRTSWVSFFLRKINNFRE